MAVKNLGPNKAPGPDGVTAAFIHAYWDLLRPAVLSQVRLFFCASSMPREISHSNLVLIPKCNSPTTPSDFRPISVCNMVCKIIAKVLAARLQPLMPKLVSDSQSAFIRGREITDNVVILREVMHSFKSDTFTTPAFCLKADLSKAFDRMDWTYLSAVLRLYNFPSEFVGWIMACVRSANYTILLNGKGTGFITPEQGLRQGCPLSPYLFILGMDLLVRSLSKEVRRGRVQPLRLTPSGPPISAILYADDLVITGIADYLQPPRIL